MYWLFFLSKPVPDSKPIPRTLHFQFTLRNTSPQFIKAVSFQCLAPVKSTSTQQCGDIEASYPFSTVTDALGNRRLLFEKLDFPPYQVRTIIIYAKLLQSTEPFSAIGKPDLDTFVFPAESTTPIVEMTARLIGDDTAQKIAQRIYQWVISHIKYGGYENQARSAAYAIENKVGDCTEFANVFAALCGAKKIPVRRINGYLVKNRVEMRAIDLHDWCEFFDGNIWQLVDAQQKVFNARYSDYVAIKIISNSQNSAFDNTYRFKVDHRQITVQMK